MLAQELHKPVIKKLKSSKAFARFKDDIWATDLAEMGSLPSKDRGVKYLLCVIDVFTKYAWVKKIAFHRFTEIVNESKHKPNKLWVDQ